ncbi:hypothetical protein [Streptomyces vinaceus]|uniref:hypothetical protein n=1 Tax=Streptomyces vinaceus TaxID=1960 RepID=UPI0037F7E500
MYGWLWRRLPGPAWMRVLIACASVASTVAILFHYVFPWAEPLLPIGDAIVDKAP